MDRQQRIRMAGLGGALVLGAVLLLLAFSPRMGLRPRTAPARPAQGAADSPRRPAPVPGLAPASAGRSELVDGLNSPQGSVHADLRLIDGVFNAYRGALRTGNPVGENVEITAALMGRNKLGFAFIPADCPGHNARGELSDRWGSP